MAELASCLRSARRNGVYYQVNTHHRHVAEVREFTAAAQRLLGRQQAVFIDAATSFQTLASLLDILAAALGSLRPWGWVTAPGWPDSLRGRGTGGPLYRTVEGLLAGIPATLRVQHQMDPAQPDNYAHVWHRITIGTEGGNLTLVGSGGPTLWCSRPHMPPDASSLTGYDELTEPHLTLAAAEPLGPATAPDWMGLLTVSWPDAVRRALTQFWAAALAGGDPLAEGQSQLAICELSAEILSLLGPVELTSCTTPRALSARDLIASEETG
jgi:thiazolinyl imide reductase